MSVKHVFNFISDNVAIIMLSRFAWHVQVDKDLRVMLVKPDAPPPKTVDVTVWPKAIPQFNLHHLDQVQVCSASTPHCLQTFLVLL